MQRAICLESRSSTCTDSIANPDNHLCVNTIEQGECECTKAKGLDTYKQVS